MRTIIDHLALINLPGMSLAEITHLAAVNMEALGFKGIDILSSLDVPLTWSDTKQANTQVLINEFLHDKAVVREMATEAFNRVREIELELSQDSRLNMRPEVRQNIAKMRLMDNGLKNMGDMFEGGHYRHIWSRMASIEDFKWNKISD